MNDGKNNLYIDPNKLTSEVDGITNFGVRIPFTVQPLEPYGGPAGSFVYTMDHDLSFNKVILRPDYKIG